MHAILGRFEAEQRARFGQKSELAPARETLRVVEEHSRAARAPESLHLE
jgi:hypothetical protein